MKLSKIVQDLLLSALNEEDTDYFVSTNATIRSSSELDNVLEYRYIFIDDEEAGFRIRITQFKMKKPVDSVDILEMMRVNKMFPENNVSKSTLQEALDYYGTGGEVNPLLLSFFEQNKKKDHQIIAHRSHHHKGVVTIFKESNDEFAVIGFTEPLF